MWPWWRVCVRQALPARTFVFCLHLPVLPWLKGLKLLICHQPKGCKAHYLQDSHYTTASCPYCERVKVWVLKSSIRLTLAESGHNNNKKSGQATYQRVSSLLGALGHVAEIWAKVWPSRLCPLVHFAAHGKLSLLVQLNSDYSQTGGQTELTRGWVSCPFWVSLMMRPVHFIRSFHSSTASHARTQAAWWCDEGLLKETFLWMSDSLSGCYCFVAKRGWHEC